MKMYLEKNFSALATFWSWLLHFGEWSWSIVQRLGEFHSSLDQCFQALLLFSSPTFVSGPLNDSLLLWRLSFYLLCWISCFQILGQVKLCCGFYRHGARVWRNHDKCKCCSSHSKILAHPCVSYIRWIFGRNLAHRSTQIFLFPWHGGL